MNYKKAIGGSVAAIITLVISQISAQLLASAFVLLKVPAGICNIIAGILYIGITFMLLKILVDPVSGRAVVLSQNPMWHPGRLP